MPWTLWHAVTYIPCMILYINIAIFIGKLLKNKNENIRLIPVHVISSIIIILEIIKQIRSIIKGYSLDNLPFYYCSLFIYLFSLTSLYKGKYKKQVRFLTALSGVTVIGVMNIMPRIIYNENDLINFFNNFDSFHTVFYHNIVYLGTCLIFSLNLLDFKIKNKFWIILAFNFSYCLFVIPISLGLNVNFNQFYNSNIPIIESLRLFQIEKLGYWGQIIYDIEVTFSTVAFSIFIYFILNFILTKINKNNIIKI